MKVRITRRPPVGMVYDVRVGSEHEVVEMAHADNGSERGYWIEVPPRQRRILLLKTEAEPVEEERPTHDDTRAAD